MAVEQGNTARQFMLDRVIKEKNPIDRAQEEQALVAAEEEKKVRREEKRSEFLRLTEAAKLGDAVAQYELGIIYSLGEYPTKQNLNTASTWFHKSADKGYSEAQFSLGYMYETGTGGNEKVISRAKDLYKKAADQGNRLAERRLCALSHPGYPRDEYYTAMGCYRYEESGGSDLLPCLLLPFLCM